MISNTITILLIAFLLDILFADPFWLYHPVQLIGLFSIIAEKQIRRIKWISLYLLGILHWVVIVTIFVGLFLVIKYALEEISLSLLYLFYIYITYSLLALGSLTREARVIYNFLNTGDLKSARTRVQGIVSRDMSEADEQQIIRAVIETTTENLSDGIIAPLFFYGLGGPILMLVYKITNTLDSMVGYKNNKYLKYGWFSAKTDDLLNIIPARLTGLIIILTAYIKLDSPYGAWQSWRRDAQKGPSPNGGIPIVTYAGARNIRLGGPCLDKDGKVIEIPFVGGKNSFNREEIKTAITYTYLASMFTLILVIAYISNI